MEPELQSIGVGKIKLIQTRLLIQETQAENMGTEVYYTSTSASPNPNNHLTCIRISAVLFSRTPLVRKIKTERKFIRANYKSHFIARI